MTDVGEISLQRRTPELYAAEMSGAEGDLIESLRDDCGVIIGVIDWVARKLGFDLIGSIFDPIAGGFSTVDQMSATWVQVGRALEDVSANYDDMVAKIPGGWRGDAATAATGNFAEMSEAHGIQAEACTLMARQLQTMLEATRTTCELVAQALSWVDEIVLSLTVAKVIKEIATMGGSIRKCVTFIKMAIDYIQDLNKLSPALLRAAAAFGALLYGINTFMKVVEVTQQTRAGSGVNETAAAGA